MALGVFKLLNFDLGKVVVDTTSLEPPKNLNSREMELRPSRVNKAHKGFWIVVA